MTNKFQTVSDPGYISAQMFAKVLREKFFENINDPAVRNQAMTLIKLFRSSGCQAQVIVDILEAVKISGKTSPEGVAEIGFAMGVQYGFELAQTYPALTNS
jgi:hypothetical protein